MFGRPQLENGVMVIESPIHLDDKKLVANSQNNFAYWSKNCGYAVHFEDMGSIDNTG